MIKIDKLYVALRKESLISIFGTLFLALVFWYQISPIAFKNYDTICRATYGHANEYDKCMNPYWSQYGLDKTGMITSLVLTGIFMVIFITGQLSRKQKT